MKKLLGITMLVSAASFAKGYDPHPQRVMESGVMDFGVGVMIGEPTGASAKYNLDAENAIDGALGWSFLGNGKFATHVDYLRHIRSLFQIDGRGVDMHFGAGIRMKMREDNAAKKAKDTDTKIGLRAPLGLDYMFGEVPIELFAEAALVLDFAPETELDFNGGVGGRWYF